MLKSVAMEVIQIESTQEALIDFQKLLWSCPTHHTIGGGWGTTAKRRLGTQQKRICQQASFYQRDISKSACISLLLFYVSTKVPVRLGLLPQNTEREKKSVLARIWILSNERGETKDDHCLENRGGSCHGNLPYLDSSYEKERNRVLCISQ